MAAHHGEFNFKAVEGWGHGSGGRVFGGVTPAVATDSRDRVYIARREPRRSWSMTVRAIF